MDVTFARVGFDATMDEIVEVNLRQFTVSARHRRQLQRARLWLGVTVALLVLGGPSSLWPAGHGIVQFPVALAFAILGGWLGARAYVRSLDKKVRRLVTEQLRGARTLPVEVELRSAGVWLDQDKVQRQHQWSDVTAVSDTSSGVEIVMRNALLMVRNRVFPTSAEREAFIAHARRLAANGTAVAA